MDPITDSFMESTEEFRSDEDKIINNIIIEGNNRQFDDTDFLPIRQSLYTNVAEIPEYDGDTFHRVVWCRPNIICELPDYFTNQSAQQIGCVQGTLPDEVFVGSLMAVAAYLGRDLLENIIASKPNDFKDYGIYTCRFYVEGEWVEVVTDTNLPCLRDENTGNVALCYAQSLNMREMWIPFIQKAYAKAVGSYEAIQKVRVHEALLHLTGGSVHQTSFHDPNNKDFSMAGGTFKFINRHWVDETLILLLPLEKAISKDPVAIVELAATEAISNPNMEVENDEVSDMFHMNRIYSVVGCRDVGGFELVLLHNPWGSDRVWTGSWSDSSNDWDLYPEILHELESDDSIPWRRNAPSGYFWMTGKMVHKYFNTAYTCKLFPSEKFSFYCVKGEWKEKTAGGGISLIRDKLDILKDAQISRINAQQKAVPTTIIDGEVSWFYNPQYRVQVAKPTTLFVSILSSSGAEDNKSHSMALTITSMSLTASMVNQKHLWESTSVDVVATVRPDSNPRVKGQEASVWHVSADPSKIYHIVAHTHRPNLEGSFIVRIFSTEAIVVEKVPALENKTTRGGWLKTTDVDSTGGPILIKKDDVAKENAKWCQNPQYHLELANPFSKEEVYLKVALKWFDRDSTSGTMKKNASEQKIKPAKSAPNTPSNGAAAAFDKEVTIGLVICRAECLEAANAEANRKKRQPRENIFGELMATKESTLRRDVGTPLTATFQPPGTASSAAAVSGHTPMHGNAASKEEVRTILRKISLSKDLFYVETTCCSKSDATVFFPKLPRSWMPHGLLIIPFLNDKNSKGTFELDVYCSEAVKLTHMPDGYSRCVAGEWKEGQAGGGHLLPSWKKNPKYSLKVRNSSYGAPSNVRISLTRFGSKWRAQCKKDTVGCMIGFYIFRNKGGELTQIFDSSFVPIDENTTEPSLQLGPLAADEVYTIMPTTFSEAKMGPFVLTVMSERDFTLKLDK